MALSGKFALKNTETIILFAVSSDIYFSVSRGRKKKPAGSRN